MPPKKDIGMEIRPKIWKRPCGDYYPVNKVSPMGQYQILPTLEVIFDAQSGVPG